MTKKSFIRTQVRIQPIATEVHENAFSSTYGALCRRGGAEAAQRRHRALQSGAERRRDCDSFAKCSLDLPK